MLLDNEVMESGEDEITDGGTPTIITIVEEDDDKIPIGRSTLDLVAPFPWTPGHSSLFYSNDLEEYERPLVSFQFNYWETPVPEP